MKEYGADLQKEYNDTKSKLANLEGKIEKRVKLIQKRMPDVIVDDWKLREHHVLHYSHEYMLAIIIEVEKQYVSKSTQLDAFDSNQNKK